MGFQAVGLEIFKRVLGSQIVGFKIPIGSRGVWGSIIVGFGIPQRDLGFPNSRVWDLGFQIVGFKIPNSRVLGRKYHTLNGFVDLETQPY